MVKDDTTGNFEKLEFWALTALFVFSLPMWLRPYYGGVDTGGFVRYVGLFLVFLYVNFRLVPKIVDHNYVLKGTLLVVGIFAGMVTMHFLTTMLIDQAGWQSVYSVMQDSLVRSLAILLIFCGYAVLKRLLVYMISKSDEIQAFFIIFNRDSLVVIALWLLIAYCMAVIQVPGEIWFGWLSLVPTGLILYGLSFNKFIPGSLRWKYPLISYLFKVFLFGVATVFVVMLPVLLITNDEETGFGLGVFNAVIHFIITAPGLWLIYRWQMKGKEEIYALRSELGRSAANLDFLRSQINPHFLFNALNTIYGLAIHEKAERTSESIQKLGEMMRFMLNENTQERIPLDREIEYLNNYISLQKLRTDSNTVLRVQVDIPGEIETTAQITPMLLIPFVENAFKHGISLREESYIKISLELKGTTLYFDVLNSTHPKNGNDPEKNSNGIGIANVRYRLQHLYPGKHQITIRETTRDFFVHLKVDL